MFNGWIQIEEDGYYVLQRTPPAGATLIFNDSLLLKSDAKTANARQAIILPLRKGKYALRLQRPAHAVERTPLYFGMYCRETGDDEWWNKPLQRW